MADIADILVVGAGIAGASVAYELAASRPVLLLEREDRPGYHSTGRSAAMLIATYGTEAVRRLTKASLGFLKDPPKGFTEKPLLSPRGHLHIAREDQRERLLAFERGARALVPSLRRLDKDAVLGVAPLIDPGYVAAGVFEADAMAIDDALLHQGYLRGFVRRGGRLITEAEVLNAKLKDGGGWRLETGEGAFEADVVVNAAGAWGDELAKLAGVPPIGLQPKRRTAILVDAPEVSEVSAGMPMVTDIDDQLYVKPEGGGFMVSPADETPVPPSDIQPEELDVAITIDRFETLIGTSVKTIRRRWAGLRSFVPDHNPVIGFDGKVPGFFWLVGQGGFGIMTAPGAAKLAAAMIAGRQFDDDLQKLASAIAAIR